MSPNNCCPTFIHPVHIQEDRLVLFTPEKPVQIQAPTDFIQRAVDWCRGLMDMGQLRQKAQETWGNEEFIHFIEQLLNAGFMVDSATTLLRRWRYSANYGNRLGRALPKEEWPTLRLRLPDTLDSNTKPLPTAHLPRLGALLAERHSCRAFEDDPVTTAQLSSLLAAAYGLARPDAASAAGVPVPRTVPSGGALYPLKLTLVLRRNVEDLIAGVYRVQYSRNGQVGLQVIHQSLDELQKAFPEVPGLMNAAGMVIVSGDLLRSARKYRNMALTLGLLEAGCVLQNLGLAAVEARLGWTAVNGFDSRQLSPLCGLEESDFVLTSGFFGIASPDTGGTDPNASDLITG